MSDAYTVGVIGIGSIGSVLAEAFDAVGHRVVVNDIDVERVRKSPHRAVDKSQMAQSAEYIVIAVPTPTTENGGDVTAVERVVGAISDTAATVIVRSTMPPETTKPLADRYDVPLVYSPEFLRDRSDASDVFQQDRLVLAGPEPARQSARQLLDDELFSINQVIETSDYLTAELGKEAHNAIFATKVSFANQLRMIAEAGGADPREAMDIVTADSRTNPSHLDPMLGPYGGKCLPKDTRALTLFAEEMGVPTPLLRGTIDMNQQATSEYDDIPLANASTDTASSD